MEDQDWTVRLAMKLATAALQYGTNEADLRTWTTLPKYFKYTRFPTPADRKVTVRSGMSTVTVDLVPGKVNVITVKSINSVTPLFVDQFSFP